MIEQFILSTNVVLPLFIVIAFGYLVSSLKWIERSTFKQLNNLVFKIILPLHIANSLYKSSAQDFEFSPNFLPVILIFSLYYSSF